MESGLPSFPRDFACPVVLRIPLRVRTTFGYAALTLCGAASQQLHLAVGLVTLLTGSYNPSVQARWFGLFRFRSPLLSESLLISLPPGTEMVHFPGLARTRLWIQRAVIRFCRTGFPHSEIPGSKPACGYPGLIAACHVLHRLLAPRHPPHALSSLTLKLTYAVVAPCASRRSDLQGLSSRDRCLGRSQGYPPPVVSPAKDTHARTRRLGMLLEQNFAVIPIDWYPSGHCQPIQFSKSASPAPGRTADSEPRKTGSKSNKKPGVERRVSPLHTLADARDARLSSSRYP